MSSVVAVWRSCRSLRATPISMPGVKTLLPLIVPYAPSGANVTLLLFASSIQFDGTLTRNRSPSVYDVTRALGGRTRDGVGRLSGSLDAVRPLVLCFVAS